MAGPISLGGQPNGEENRVQEHCQQIPGTPNALIKLLIISVINKKEGVLYVTLTLYIVLVS